jgi:hypothetical protein
MANENTMSSYRRPDKILSALTWPALVENAIAIEHCAIQEVDTHPTVDFVIDGSLTGGVASEGAAASLGAGQELTQSGVVVTVAKHVSIIKPTVEAIRFAGSAKMQNMADAQAKALARSLDTSWIALFDDFTSTENVNPVNSGTITYSDLLGAVYQVDAGLLGAASGKYHAVLDRKAVYELKAEQAGSVVSVYNVPAEISLFNGMKDMKSKNYYGKVGVVDVYAHNGLPTAASGVADVGLVFDPSLAFALAIDKSGVIYAPDVFDASGGFITEVSAYLFANVAVFRDEAGCKIPSAT